MTKIRCPLAGVLSVFFAAYTLFGATPVKEYEKLYSQYTVLAQQLKDLKKLVRAKEAEKKGNPYTDIVPSLVNGRLTLESAVPISTSDQTGKSTVYFTPYHGNKITLYSGSAWVFCTFSEISLNLSSLTSGKNYDVFAYNNSGTVTLELSAAWTDDTTRATSLVLQDGIYVKFGAATRRYLGTIRTTSTTTTEDSKSKRYVWNYYNRSPRFLTVQDATASWTYSTDNTWRSANASTSNRFEAVIGLNEVLVKIRIGVAGKGTDTEFSAGVGIDSTSANSALVAGAYSYQEYKGFGITEYAGFPGVGYHYFQWIEACVNNVSGGGGTTATYYGSTAPYQAGMMGIIDG